MNVLREGIKADERRFLVGAHRELYPTVRKAEAEVRKSRPRRLTDAPVGEEPEEEFDIDLEDPQVEAAAGKIQAGFRGMQGRSKAKQAQSERKAENSSVDKFLAKAEKKFKKFDTSGNGTLEGDELLNLAAWVWTAFNPDGKEVTEKEKEALSAKIMLRNDDGDKVIPTGKMFALIAAVTHSLETRGKGGAG